MLIYAVTLERADGQVIVRSDRFPEMFTYGDDREDALHAARDALIESLVGRIRDREDIPEGLDPAEIDPANEETLPLPTQIELKVSLYREMRRQGVTKAELARRLECNQKQIDRLLDLRHASRLDQIDQAYTALGKRPTLRLLSA